MKKLVSLVMVLCMVLSCIPVFAESNTVITVSAGGEHSLAIKEDGSLWAWGYNGWGQIGDGTMENGISPVKIMDNVKTVSAGEMYSLAIKEDNSLWAWGLNGWGQIGDGTMEQRLKPVKIMEDVKIVSAGGSHSFAIKEDGSLWAWGANFSGQLGDGTTESSYVPVEIMEDVKAVSGGDFHSLAIKKDGSLWAWGDNSYGQIGDGTMEQRLKPVKIMENVKLVSTGDSHSLAIKEDGSLWVWGDNGKREPTQIMENVKAVSAGLGHSLAIREDGSLWAWGDNDWGQLGDGTTESRREPTHIMENVKAVSAGGWHSLAIKEDGSLWAWGRNGSGQIGDGTKEDRLEPVKVGDGFMVASVESEPEYEVEVAIEPEYIYGNINEDNDIDVSGKIEGIETADDAKNAVDNVAEALTEEQKTSPVAVDKLTLLAEEAISTALTIDLLGSNVVITDELIEEAAESANELSAELEQTLEENGVKTHRKMRRFVTINTSQSQTVTIDKGAIKADIEGVKVVTDFASVTMGTDDENIVSITNEGENAISIEFENDDAKSVKVSFPDVETDGQFIAVVDENGKAVGGKYNPATGDVEAKISESGIYKVMENEKNFDDIKSKSTEMQDAIKTLAAKGIINGTSQTTFSPDSSISRAEVAALVIRTLSKLDANEDGGFTDVTRENWYFGAAGSSKKHGIIKGYEDNTFRGTAVIAKDQIVAVAARVLKNEMNYKTPSDIDKHLETYNDKDAIAQWAQGDVAIATMADLVIKRTDGSFKGTMPMTRGDAAIILYRLFMKIW